MAAVSQSFDRLPFADATAFFANKIQLPSSGWTDIWQEQHSHGFIVAGATSDSLVNDFYNAIKKVQESGGRYEDWRQHFDKITKDHGWSYNGSAGWRSRIIYDTNMGQAYHAGRWQQIQAVKHLRPYLRYDHTSIEHPRLEHLAWDGLILPVDDPWWYTHMPQNGWRCQCRVSSLSITEASSEWEKSGKDGPDTAPEIEWEEKTVGAYGSNPRTVMVPKGIDPGFAYNPGKAWLEPHTVPPLTGYDAVLKERGVSWPTGFTPPPMPTPTKVPGNYILPDNTKPETAVRQFLHAFGADIGKGSVFTDKTGVPLAITDALFKDGKDELKWIAEPGKSERTRYIRLLADTIKNPDEIWWIWEKSRTNPDKWLLRRRYLKAFEIDETGEYGVSAFEWDRYGWTGSTAFMPDNKSSARREKYFDNQRVGRLLYKK